MFPNTSGKSPVGKGSPSWPGVGPVPLLGVGSGGGQGPGRWDQRRSLVPGGTGTLGPIALCRGLSVRRWTSRSAPASLHWTPGLTSLCPSDHRKVPPDIARHPSVSKVTPVENRFSGGRVVFCGRRSRAGRRGLRPIPECSLSSKIGGGGPVAGIS